MDTRNRYRAEKLELVDVSDFEDGFVRGAIYLVADPQEASNHSAAKGCANNASRQLRPSAGECGFGLSQRGFVHRELRAGVLHFFAGRDTTSKKIFIPR